MKMIMMDIVMVTGVMSLMGYYYMKKHPEKVKQMKDILKNTSDMVCSKMETED